MITGRITNSMGIPLQGVSVSHFDIDNYNYSDQNGIFHIHIDNECEKKIHISYLGYNSLQISNSDTISSFIDIVMYEDTSFNKMPYPTQKLKYGMIFFIQVDYIINNFNDFQPLLKDYNIDLMNNSSGIFSMEIAGTYKRYYLGLNFGYADDSNSDHDSLDINFNTNQYGLHFGYNLLSTKRLLFTPKVAIKWNRYRLMNYDKDNKIPIEQYVSERDLDLRFNQVTGFVGFNLSYKMYKYNLFASDYWTFGIYGGYAFKVNDKPWIYSRGNRLTSNGTIGMEKYNIGIHFSFNFEGQ